MTKKPPIHALEIPKTPISPAELKGTNQDALAVVERWEQFLCRNSRTPTFRVTPAVPVVTAGTLKKQAILAESLENDLYLSDDEDDDMDLY